MTTLATLSLGWEGRMIKSELVQRIAERNPHLFATDADRIVNTIFDEIATALARCGASTGYPRIDRGD